MKEKIYSTGILGGLSRQSVFSKCHGYPRVCVGGEARFDTHCVRITFFVFFGSRTKSRGSLALIVIMLPLSGKTRVVSGKESYQDTIADCHVCADWRRQVHSV